MIICCLMRFFELLCRLGDRLNKEANFSAFQFFTRTFSATRFWAFSKVLCLSLPSCGGIESYIWLGNGRFRMQISTKATKFCSSVCLSVLALYLKRILLGRKKIASVWVCRTKPLPDEFTFCDVRQILTVKFLEMHQTSRTVVKTFSVSWIWPFKNVQGEFI